MDDKPVELLGQLKHLIQALDDLNELLKLDRDYFSQNNADALKKSDAKKQLIIEKISHQLLALQTSMPDARENFIKALREHTKKFHAGHEGTVDTLIQTLQGKLSDGYEHLITNNHIVTMNLRYMENLWTKLLALSPENHSTYDNPATQPR